MALITAISVYMSYRYPKNSCNYKHLYIQYWVASFLFIPLFFLQILKKIKNTQDWFFHYKIQIELKINQKFNFKKNVHLGVLHLFFDTQGVWPFKSIKSLDKGGNLNILKFALKNHDILDYNEIQWNELFIKTDVFSNTINSIRLMRRAVENYRFSFTHDIKRIFLSHCNFNETVSEGHQNFHVVNELFYNFSSKLTPEDWELILKKKHPVDEKMLGFFLRQLYSYHFESDYLNYETWKYLIQNSDLDKLKNQINEFLYRDFLILKSTLLNENLNIQLNEKNTGIEKKKTKI